jgi:UDP-N-acetyl-D-galactosamine dehydrogenase
VHTYDPWADAEEVKEEYGIALTTKEQLASSGHYDAIVLAVAHDAFLETDISAMKGERTIVYDVKGILPQDIVDERL